MSMREPKFEKKRDPPHNSSLKEDRIFIVRIWEHKKPEEAAAWGHRRPGNATPAVTSHYFHVTDGCTSNQINCNEGDTRHYNLCEGMKSDTFHYLIRMHNILPQCFMYAKNIRDLDQYIF